MLGWDDNANGSHHRLRAGRMKALALIVWAAFGLGCGGGEPAESDMRDARPPIDDSSADLTTEPDTNDAADNDAPPLGDADAELEVETEGDAADTQDSSPEADTADSLEPVDSADAGEPADIADSIAPDDAVDTTDSLAPDNLDDITDSLAPDNLDDITDTDGPVDTDGSAHLDSADAEPLCTPTTATHPVAASYYIPVCSDVSYATDPPTSGPHYPIWATYKTYLVPINPGFLVHSLKHGAVVITWRCPAGCDAELTTLRTMLSQRPNDPQCDPLIQHRIIVAPRPDQDTMLAAAAWGASWKADCFNLAALGDFIDARYGQGLENDCFEGVDIEKIRVGNPWYCPP